MLLAELDVQQLVVISISTSLKISGDAECQDHMKSLDQFKEVLIRVT